MTSKNSFSTNMLLLFRNRLWPLAMTLLLHFLYYGVGSFLTLTARVSAAELERLPGEVLRLQKLQIMSGIMGAEGSGWLLSLCLGIALSIQGYAYLDSKRELDFYESQPVSRSTRFFSILANSCLIYVFSAVLMRMLAFLIAGLFHAMSPVLLGEALYQFFREFVLFLGSFSVATLAMMLCGNIMIALLATETLFCYEFFARLLKSYYENSFYRTMLGSYQRAEERFLSSPIYFYLRPIEFYGKPLYHAAAPGIAGRYYSGEMYLFTKEGLRGYVLDAFPWDLRGLLLAAVLLLLAFYAYRRRKNEAAGTAVVFRPVQILVKLLIASMGGLIIAGISYEIVNQSRTASSTLLVFGMLLLTVILLCCLMEIIYHFHFKALFRHPLEMLTAALLTALIFSFYRFDFAGYDSYVPKAGQVASAAVFQAGGESFVDEQGNTDYEDPYSRRSMKLTNIEAVRALAAYGQDYLCRTEAADREGCYYLSVEYTLKNGKKVGRKLCIPEDVEVPLLDNVMDTEEYRAAAWQLEGYPFVPGHEKYLKLKYENACDSRSAVPDAAMLSEFREAYARDLAQYSYRFARNSYALGEIVLSGRQSPEDSYRYGMGKNFQGTEAEFLALDVNDMEHSWYFNEYRLSYPVYPEYRNSIAFLKAHRLWLEELPDENELKKLLVTRYPDRGEEQEGEEITAEEGKELLITEPEEIRALLTGAVSYRYSGDFHSPSQYDDRYSLRLFLNTKDPDREASADYRYLSGRAPAELESRLGG